MSMNPFDIFRKDVAVTRQGAGSYVDGIWVKGASTVFNIKASVQPTKAEVLEMLPEGFRDKGSYTLFTDTELNIATTDISDTDVVTLYGERYTVSIVEPWANNLINHYKIVVIREDIDAA
jgi:hypothetical protein